VILAQPTPRSGRTSELFRRLGRKRPDMAAARALAPPEPRAARARYNAKLGEIWKAWAVIAMRESGARYDARIFTDSFDALIDRSGLRGFLTELGANQQKQVANYVQRIVRTSARPRQLEELIEDFRTRNVSLIKGLGEAQAERLKEELRLAATSGLRHEDLAAHVQRVLDVGESRARLIARDQTLKMNSALQKANQLASGIQGYVWLTVGDDVVREEHAALNGQAFNWDNPPIIDGEPLNPGEDIQCRCQAVPRISLFAGI
jgi:SPP1 gp7 family putative phage head morphogenesis protein